MPAEDKKSLRDMITDEDTERCLELLRQVRDDDAAPRSLRLQAAEGLLDRKHGKPKQFVEQQTVVATYQDLLGGIAASERRWAAVTGRATDVIDVTPESQPLCLEDLL